MTWRDNLRPAKFRGVAFRVEAHDAQGGRRTVRHDFPFRDLPFVEDMGRRGREFSVDAYVVGDDYMDQRDALIGACDEPGSAELVHPYLGTLQVTCTGWSLQETKSEGRMAKFSLTFLESGKPNYPSGDDDFASRGIMSYEEAKQITADAFADAFSIDGLPDFAVDDAIAMAEYAAELAESAVEFIEEIQQHGIGPMIGRFVSKLTGSGGLLSKPAQLANELFGIYHTVSQLFSGFGDERGAIRAMSSLFTFDGGDIVPIQQTTETRRRQQQNRDALIGLVRQAAVIEAATIAPSAEYETRDDAESVRDQITDLIDQISEAPSTSDAVFMSLQKLRTVVTEGVPPPGERLPDIVTVAPTRTTPSLVLAYDLHGDATREPEIVARNRPRHPGFMPGAEPVQVIADA